MFVIAVLIGIMLPSLSVVRETTRRVVCSSNIRQIGLGISMFADDHDGILPQTTFINQRLGRIPAETTRLRIGTESSFSSRVNTAGGGHAEWDGLGLLYKQEYLETPGIYYCPSHAGKNRFQEQQPIWTKMDGSITGNFQFRGEGPDGSRKLFLIQPRSAAIVTDSIRSDKDLNHAQGMNVLRADLAVFWFNGLDDQLMSLLRQSTPANTDRVWEELDDFVASGGN